MPKCNALFLFLQCAHSEHTQERLPQVRMCIRVINVPPEFSTWLNLGSWGWGRLHSNVRHPKSKRENPSLYDRNHISTHRFSEQKMGGEAVVPHTLHDLAIVRIACVVASGLFENVSEKQCTSCRGRAFERSPFASVSRLLSTVASSTQTQVTVPTPRDATVSGRQRGALKRSAGGAGERKSALSVRCVLSGVLGRSEGR